jgi:peptidyl-prolyl cis-trans isomerase A (cyclophilin A)
MMRFRAAQRRAVSLKDPFLEVLTMIGPQEYRRPGLALAAALVVLVASAPGFSQETSKTAKDAKEPSKDGLYVLIESRTPLAYAGDANEVTILFKNEGKENWVNPGMEIEAGFQVYDNAGTKLEKSKVAPSNKEGQPKVLLPGSYFGAIVDLNTLFPKMTALGTYKITWSGPGVAEKTIMNRVIKKYDPARDYQAVIETEFGNIVLEFYKDLAPMHVKNFIDLANQGFFDGKIFHRVIKGEAAFGGSPTGDERGGPGYTLPPEQNGLKILAGSVAQVRNTYTGQDESGSIFMIAITPQADMDGRYTVFARVVEGLETSKTISNLPTAGGAGSRVAARPIRDVVMKKIDIREKKSAKG